MRVTKRHIARAIRNTRKNPVLSDYVAQDILNNGHYELKQLGMSSLYTDDLIKGYAKHISKQGVWEFYTESMNIIRYELATGTLEKHELRY